MTAANPFFSPYPQKEISIRRYKGKSPLFYRDVHLMGAIFAAEIERIREALPDGQYHPLSILPGKGIVAVHCVEYKDCDIGPYNEVSLSIPVRDPRLTILPSPLAVLRSLLTRRYHAYVKELPVSTEAALYGGIDFFNYPKYLADVSFRETADHRVCTLRDKQSMDLILEFEGRKIKTKKSPKPLNVLSLSTYPRKENRTLHARMLLNRKEAAASHPIADSLIRFGRHPRAEPFKKLGIGRPLQYDFAPKCEAILFMPEIF